MRQVHILTSAKPVCSCCYKFAPARENFPCLYRFANIIVEYHSLIKFIYFYIMNYAQRYYPTDSKLSHVISWNIVSRILLHKLLLYIYAVDRSNSHILTLNLCVAVIQSDTLIYLNFWKGKFPEPLFSALVTSSGWFDRSEGLLEEDPGISREVYPEQGGSTQDLSGSRKCSAPSFFPRLFSPLDFHSLYVGI